MYAWRVRVCRMFVIIYDAVQCTVPDLYVWSSSVRFHCTHRAFDALSCMPAGGGHTVSGWDPGAHLHTER